MTTFIVDDFYSGAHLVSSIRPESIASAYEGAFFNGVLSSRILPLDAIYEASEAFLRCYTPTDNGHMQSAVT